MASFIKINIMKYFSVDRCFPVYRLSLLSPVEILMTGSAATQCPVRKLDTSFQCMGLSTYASLHNLAALVHIDIVSMHVLIVQSLKFGDVARAV